MNKLLYKEMKLSASPLTYFFIAAALLTFVPGYPILLGAFFTTLGIFYSFQSMRENNDIRFSLLLPISKKDIVKGKFAFVVFIEMCAFVVMAVITVIRMSFMNEAAVYTSNALMCANLTFLGFALIMFGLFNIVFIAGFFKTAYFFGKPFIIYCIVSMLATAAAETLHYIPGTKEMYSLGFENMPLQLSALFVGAAVFMLLTFVSLKKSVKSFENTDL